MSTQQTTSLRDSFLIAMPSLENSFFSHTITYICDHSADGAMGLVINTPLDITLKEIFTQLKMPENPELADVPVMAGGPVEMGRGFVLHSPDKTFESTLPLSPDLCLTASQEIIEAMARGHGPERFMVALGYAGWGPGQLEEELADNAWLTMEANPSVILSTPVEQRWSMVAQQMGIDLNLISSVAGHA